MTVKPLFDKVVVKMTEVEEVSKGGIILTAASKEKPQFAEVVAVSNGKDKNGDEINMTVNVGDKVVLANYAGTKVKVDGDELIIVIVTDILAIVE
ncbi:MAG: co-chaperone GroES [Clostridia bacterium]|nr:co-chaperone GroES [Clostridia bacterium]